MAAFDFRAFSESILTKIRQQFIQREQVLRAASEAARDEAETAREQVSNILESITDAFVAFDRQWRFTYVNQEATKLLRKSRAELLGKEMWRELFEESNGTVLERELRRAVAEQTSLHFEEFFQRLISG